MSTVITAIFGVESEAYKAFSELRSAPKGENYIALEGALLKRKGDSITLIGAFDTGINTTDDTTAGFIIGSLAGILGGPLGVLLGASTGTLTGSILDVSDAAESSSLIEVTAAKLYDGETAIITLVDEEEPAFDAAFAEYETTIIRYDEQAVADEVDRAIETMEEMRNLAKQQLRSDRKAKLSERHSDRIASLKARFDTFVAKKDEALEDVQDRFEEHSDEVDARVEKVDQAISEKADDLLGTKDAIDGAIDKVNARLDAFTTDVLGLD